ncbi:MAG: hypothetical protein WC901_00180 [Candidatus Margulisiibacteriota bacterium]
MGLYATQGIEFANRVVRVMARRTNVLWGLSVLASRVRREFLDQRVNNLDFDFKQGMAGSVAISPAICRELTYKGVDRLRFSIGSGSGAENSHFPDSTLVTAVKCGLRYLASNGIPRADRPEIMDLTWKMPGDESTPNRGVRAQIKISRSEDRIAEIEFSYQPIGGWGDWEGV